MSMGCEWQKGATVIARNNSRYDLSVILCQQGIPKGASGRRDLACVCCCPLSLACLKVKSLCPGSTSFEAVS